MPSKSCRADSPYKYLTPYEYLTSGKFTCKQHKLSISERVITVCLQSIIFKQTAGVCRKVQLKQNEDISITFTKITPRDLISGGSKDVQELSRLTLKRLSGLGKTEFSFRQNTLCYSFVLLYADYIFP